MGTQRNEKIGTLIKQLAAVFFESETNKSSMITVTDCKISEDSKRGLIFITVFPEDKEEEALNFTKRKRTELRDYVKEKLNIKIIPFLEIKIDIGEKNRQKIESLLREADAQPKSKEIEEKDLN